MLDKSLFGILSVSLTIVSTLPYIWLMVKGNVRPHIFSWIIWCVACSIIFAVQYLAGAGPGAWATLISALIALIIVLLSLSQKSDWSITRTDWIAFIGSLAIIPIWYVTGNALVAAILATIIDSLAYYPTFRKSYHKPHQEMVFLYFIANLKHIASILAMSQYSVTVLVMPVTMLAINAGLITVLFWRRQVLAVKM